MKFLGVGRIIHRESEDEKGKRGFVECLIRDGRVKPEDKDIVLKDLLNTDIRIRSIFE